MLVWLVLVLSTTSKGVEFHQTPCFLLAANIPTDERFNETSQKLGSRLKMACVLTMKPSGRSMLLGRKQAPLLATSEGAVISLVSLDCEKQINEIFREANCTPITDLSL